VPGLFSFPDPVNDTSARAVATGVVGMATAAVVADQPWILFPLTYGFAARVATGPTLSPLGQLATRVVTPLIPVEHTFSPGPPKRFAQSVGLMMSTAALVLHYGLGRRKAAKGLLAALILAASLEAFLGVCLGCKIFSVAVRAGLVADSVCEECTDIGSRPSPGAETG